MLSLTVDFAKAAKALDLDRRLAEVPPTAHSRGIFFNLVENELARRGLGQAAAAKALLGSPRHSFGFYPTRELLELYAKAGALIDEDAREGIRQVFFGTASYFASTWYGRAFRRLLRPDPAAALDYIERSRDLVADYGYWRIEHRGAGHATIHMFDEYLWIDSAQLGGCQGLLTACGVIGEVRAELDSSFRGRLDVRWQLES